MKPVVLACVASLLTAGSLPVGAQSLTEIARQEKLRREALAEKAAAENLVPKVYTDADLRGGGRLTTTNVQPVPPVTSETDAEATPPDEDTLETGGPLTEEQWRDRISTVRQEQERAQLLAEALQSRVDGLWADFTARDNPVERTGIEQNRLAAEDELENTIAAIADLDQELADIQDEARRANVPPGWLR
ncbi:MAG: hypothetical protein CL477_04640 [Acidobacteria bacterium]|jgi:hypothetical protein|nr:hypothetical protein [Acidobacteriota bacterium]MDP7337799.1 hypothetical protein [Vicinamibacterales bacterium]MDP7477873.1 hypothetical protein [Vicinamibacterales bacterium]MDP7690400.1 hypothetical protein [Vicinamibacterales bacterium]HJN44667.1 hypothetical protein [Vicinamibacterales bacterium]|tara:strand:+ start:92 stop:661 length:570 start_codon:yes stop_codon:yes gene_type:complete